ncbi:sulfatase [Marinilongibacter aquaticus]|uniref:sulfatase family protein n=1 Tax=Marinilongibacter aquaticus TaxID=2975157 RepID=UPI0021BD2B68|nr:sulfatase [Marinilongibacter aquaticus]UBM58696.1 sulfatase [Marinilongibacter aquaticus]
MQINFKNISDLILITFCSSTFFSCQTHESSKEVETRPNILFAIADDQSFPHTGIYGFSEISTPAFDQVAKSGILFNNAFVAAPQCSPSRASILTGKNIWQLEEAGTHSSSFPKKFTVFTDLLENAGYSLGYTGKAWGPGNWKISGRSRNPVGPEFSDKKMSDTPTSGINANDYFENFKTFMDQREEGKPFFFWYGSYEPHRKYEEGSGKESGKNLAKAMLPSFLPDNEITRGDILDYALEIEHFDDHLNKMLQFLAEKGELENTLIVVTADNGMPFPYAKANLQEYGTHVPLAISWPRKISKKRTTDELVSLIDLAPTFLEMAGVENLPKMTGLSLTPILFDEVKSQRDFVLTGRERHTHARPDNLGYPARAIRTQDYLLVKNYKTDRWPMGDPVLEKSDTQEGQKSMFPGYHDIDDSPSKTWMIEMKDNHKLFEIAFEKRPSVQLYDIKKDPGCLNDLSSSSDLDSLKSKLLEQLDRELEKEGDPRMKGSEVFDSYPRYAPMRNFSGFKERGAYNPQYVE